MTLRQQLTEDMKTAMKARDALKLSVIRFLLSEIKNVEIDKGPQDDEGIVTIIKRQVKQVQDAIDGFVAAQRDDLASEEKLKLEVLQTYLPAQMSDEELNALVSQVVSGSEQKTMQVVMPLVMAQVAGRADGKRVSSAVQQALRA